MEIDACLATRSLHPLQPQQSPRPTRACSVVAGRRESVSKGTMVVSTRFPPGLAATLATVIVLGTPRVTLAQKHMNDEPPGAACQSEIRKLGAPRFGRSVTSPMIIRRVRPAYPTIPSGTTGGGVWIGELLIDARGRVSNAWTIREVKLTPAIPSLTKAITD